MQATDVLWSERSVVFKVPQLPSTASAQNWDVSLKEQSAATACGPYAVNVDAGPAAATCPTGTRVADGVTGSATQPAARGKAIMISATAGAFGSAPSAKVHFGPPVDLSGAPVTLPGFPSTGIEATVISYSQSAVAFVVPSTLPSVSGPLKWPVTVTPSGATSGCGPYDVVVEANLACPPSALVLTAGSLPANSGSPVTVVAVGGTFGPATATSGGVEIRKGTKTWTLPASSVVWSSLAVTFRVPEDVTTSPTGDMLEVFLKPQGFSSSCGPYALRVLAVPVLLFVPPVSVSERRLDLVATGLGSSVDVGFYLPDGTKVNQSVPPPKRTPTGVACQVPTLSELMASLGNKFRHNQLTMQLNVTVKDLASGQESPRNPLHSTVVTLPAPVAGPLSGSVAGQRLVFGDPNRPAELGDQSSLEWLGQKARGSVTFHTLDPQFIEKVETLRAGIIESIDADVADTTLPGNLQSDGAVLKATGKPATDIPVWKEERLEVVPPAGWRNGTILIWRDGLPTAPMVIPDIPLPDLCNPVILKAAVEDLIGFAVPATLNPNDALSVNMVRKPLSQAGEAGKALNGLLGGTTTALQITRATVLPAIPGIPLNGPADNSALNIPYGDLVGAGANIISGVRCEPAISGRASGDERQLFIDATATVTGLPGCIGGVTLKLRSPAILQLPIRVPAVVAGFDHKDPDLSKSWGGGAVVFVNSAVGLPPVAADKSVIVSTLRNIVNLVDTLKAIFPNVGGVASLASRATGVDRLLNKLDAATDVVVTASASGKLGDLNPSRYDFISSLWMFGVPGTATLRLFERDNQTGGVFACTIRSGHIAGSYWTVHESVTDDPGFSSPPTLCGPAGGQNPTGWWANRSFGNISKSWRWD